MRNARFLIICMVCLALFSCKKEVVQSEPVLSITTPVQPVIYDESRIFRVPGNYQDWDVPGAPKLVSVNGDGQYEGYIHFTRPDTQFWLVQGTSWDNVTTYNETGNNTFGHNGGYFTIPSGAGVYRVTADKNTFTWSCTRIYSWSINGTAVSTDADLVFDTDSLSWHITGNFLQGDFVFRANQSNAIVFGQQSECTPGVAGYNGEKISLPGNANYTITLSLQSAGNYTYSIHKNN